MHLCNQHPKFETAALVPSKDLHLLSFPCSPGPAGRPACLSARAALAMEAPPAPAPAPPPAARTSFTAR